MQRARRETERILENYTPVRTDRKILDELTKLMKAEAKRFGMDRLPATE